MVDSTRIQGTVPASTAPSGRRGRPRRRIAITVATTVALVVGAVGPALAAPLTPTDISALDAGFRAQQAAQAQRQASELVRFDTYWAQKVADRQAAAAAERAAAEAAMEAAAVPIRAERDARIADAEHRRQVALAAIDAVYAAKLARFQDLVSAGSATVASPPLSSTALSAALSALSTKLKNDRSALAAEAKAVTDSLKVQIYNGKKASRDLTKAYQDALAARLAILTNEYNQRVTAAKAQSAARVAQLNAELSALSSTYLKTKADLEAQRTREVNAARAAGQSTTPITSFYAARLSELKSVYDLQVSLTKTQISATQAALTPQLNALLTAYNEQLAYQTLVDTAQVSAYDANGDIGVRAIREQLAEAIVTYPQRDEDLKNIYDLDVAATYRDAALFAGAAAKLVSSVEAQDGVATTSKNNFYNDEIKLVDKWAEASTTAAQAPHRRTIQQSAARLQSDLVDLVAKTTDARTALLRRHKREQLLAKTDYLLTRIRAQSYLRSPSSGLTPLDNYYDPATDPGSLFNVAKGLGVGNGSPTGAGVKVALIDTGVAPVDGIAQANVTIGPDFSFEDLDEEVRGIDTNGHGTHLAGIIVGQDDAWLGGNRERSATRFVGIAPDARLIAVKAGTADGTTDVSQVIGAINWVIRYNEANPTDPIRVINLAYGTDSEQDYTIDPLAHAAERAWRAGIVVVVAAGNDGWDTAHLTNPGRDPYVLAVGASQRAGDTTVAAAYSSEGSPDRKADLLAPGRSVVSLRNPGSFSDTVNNSGRAADRFVRGSGTSQATAVVTGTVALLLQQRPWLTPDQVKHHLVATAAPSTTGTPPALRAGKALSDDTVYGLPQAWPVSTGTGSLEAARGTSHVQMDDGTPLVGEQDILGNDFSADGWVSDAWVGRSWRADGWEGRSWRENSWSGRSWRDSDWDGRSWRDFDWEGRSWRDANWEGRSWRADRWQGRSWRDANWEGRSWRSEDWEGRSWRGFGSV